MDRMLLASDGEALMKVIIFVVIGIIWLIGQIVSRLGKKPAPPPTQMPAPMPPPAPPVPHPVPTQNIPPRRPPNMPPRRPGKQRPGTLPPQGTPSLPTASVEHTTMSRAPLDGPVAVRVDSPVPTRSRPADRLRPALSAQGIRQQLIIAEILDKPLSMRQPRLGDPSTH